MDQSNTTISETRVADGGNLDLSTGHNVTDAAKKMARLTIDGKEITVPDGSPLFNAVKGVGIELPAMCYHYAFSPFGSCGICLVEVAGKSNNVRSCTAKAVDGMVVRTNTDKMIDARKKAVEKWLIIHPLDCPVCDADGKCELQDLTYNMGVYDIQKGKKKEVPEDTRSPVLDFSMERCILCGQCINVCKEVQEIDALAFYKKDGKTLVGAHEGVPLHCEFCGDCLAVCPVGAITSRFSKYAYKPWQLKKTQTTCTYCSDGCTLTLETKDSKVLRVTSKLSYLSKFGHGVEEGDDHGGLCVRGRFGFQFIQSEKRLSRPLAKTDGRQVETPWFKVIPQIARKLIEVKKNYGGQAIAGLISGRCANEEVYLFQKIMRAVLGTNHIDTAARYGHMNSVLAMQKALGISRSTTSAKQITLADVILVIGSNITETNPVASLRIKEAKSRFGAKVIVVDSVKTNMMRLCTHPLQVSVGGQTALIQGLVKAIVQNESAYSSFVTQYPKAYEALRVALAPLSCDTIAQKSGIGWGQIEEAAQLLAASKRGTIIWGEGIVAQADGQDNVLRLLDLAFLCGLFDKPGAGVQPVCEENNEQGAVDMGGVPEFLPGPIPYVKGKECFEKQWGVSLPNAVGLTLPEIIEKANQGEIKALYIVGENPVETLPASMKVREAFEKIDLIICQDPFLTKTGEMANFVLPATTFAEKDGTFTNMEGKVRRLNTALDPMGESRTDFKIFSDLLKYLCPNGAPVGAGPSVSLAGVAHEIDQAVPGYFHHERPGINPTHIQNNLEDDFVREAAGRYQNDQGVLPASNNGGMHLMLGQVIYHSGKLSTRDPGLMKIYDKPKLGVSEEDAARLEIKNGDWVRVAGSAAAGPVETAIEIMPSLPKGMVWFPEHFRTLTDLMDVRIDPTTHVPYFKSAIVTIKKIPLFDLTVVAAPTGETA